MSPYQPPAAVAALQLTDHRTHFQENAPMYDMYPDWGPASHNPENPRSARGASSARLTCETTAASAPTTTSLAA